jgi:undecaprenyl-diphosphatase
LFLEEVYFMQQAIVQIFILGIVQGITEFLPVSSSAHLIIVSTLLDGKALPMYFNVALHFGTLLAVVAYFAKDWQQMCIKFYRRLLFKEKSYESETLIPAIVVGCIPAGIIGILAKDKIESLFHSTGSIIVPLFVTGIVLWAVDYYAKSTKNLQQITIKNALLIGLIQVCALIPGVSRSGSTIIAGRLCNLNRHDSAKFSFLLGMPIILGASLLHIKDFIEHMREPYFYLGIIISCCSGLIAIRFFMNFVKYYGFLIFAIYRAILAVLILFVM